MKMMVMKNVDSDIDNDVNGDDGVMMMIMKIMVIMMNGDDDGSGGVDDDDYDLYDRDHDFFYRSWSVFIFMALYILWVLSRLWPHPKQGRIQEFHLGGAQKIICANAQYEREILSAGIQGFLMLSSAIWALFLSILIQNGL